MSRAIGRLVRAWDHEVTRAGSVAAAERALARGPFAAVISDLSLPDGTGFEVGGAARRRRRSTEVMLLAGVERPGDAELARGSGFAYLIKGRCVEAMRAQLTGSRPAAESGVRVKSR